MAIVSSSSAPSGWGVDTSTGQFAKLPAAAAPAAAPSPNQNQPTAPTYQPPTSTIKADKPYGGVVSSGTQTPQITQNPSLPSGYGVDPATGRIAKVGSIPTVTIGGQGTFDPMKGKNATTETVTTSFPDFKFDEGAARQDVFQQYDPFYQERLQDALSKYNTGNSRIQSDVQAALSDIEGGESDRVKQQNLQDEVAQKNTDQDFANRGLYWSGARDVAQDRLKQLKDVRESSLSRSLAARRRAISNQQSRASEDSTLAHTQYERDIKRAEENAVLEAIQGRRQTALQKYLNEIANTYGEDAANSLAGYY